MPNPEKKKARLEKWMFVARLSGLFLPPDHPNAQLAGDAYGHSRFLDGVFIYTSYVVDQDVKLRFVETNNTNYTLGEVSPSYLEWLVKEEVDLSKYGLTAPVEATQPVGSTNAT